MFQSMCTVPDPHASLLTLSRHNTIGVAANSGPLEPDAAWDCSDDDDEYVERLVIDVDESFIDQERGAGGPTAEHRASHLKEILQTGVYKGRHENASKLDPRESKEKDIKPNLEKIKQERVPLSAEEIQKTLNLRADEFMRNNFMQYRAGGEHLPETVQYRASVEVKTEGRIGCNLCDRTFNFKSNLARHKKHAHADATPHRCNVCRRRFPHQSTLLAHAKTHTDKPFCCEQCPRRFAYRCNLVQHARVHAGHKPFACDACDARFTRKFILTAHRRTHTGEKPFACHACERRYTNKTNLRNHVKTHDKVYVCEVCKQQFSRKFVLERHERTHAGSKPFACQVCSKRFTRNFGLQVHMRIHTGHRPFACTVCSNTFTCYRYLKTHRRRHQLDAELDTSRVLEVTLKENKMVQTDE